LQEEIPAGTAPERVFDVVHQAWNVGLSGYKHGRQTVASRIIRAGEFKQISGILMLSQVGTGFRR
jgi:hypothetical protein